MLRGALLGAALFVLLGFGSTARPVRNGRIAYAHVGDGYRFQIYSITAAGQHRHPLTTGNRYSSYDPAYSPRGNRIAFVRTHKGSRGIWTMNADGTHKRALTAGKFNLAWSVDPAWSPDGKWIAFAVVFWPEGIWLVRADGTGTPIEVTSEAEDRYPAWSPDGSQLVFERYNAAWSEPGQIMVVPVGGGAPTNVSSDPSVYSDLEPAWSPDGTKILFVSDRPESSQLDVWVMNADGSDVQRVTNTPARDETDPAWSPDGRRILYSRLKAFRGASSSQIFVSNADGSNRRKLTHACGYCGWFNDWPSWQPLR